MKILQKLKHITSPNLSKGEELSPFGGLQGSEIANEWNVKIVRPLLTSPNQRNYLPSEDCMGYEIKENTLPIKY